MSGCALFLAFTVIPAVELWLLVRLGSLYGAGETVVYVVAMGVLGAWLGKRAGFSVLRELSDEMAAGRPPTDKLVEAVLVLVGAVMLITPGVMTDIVGTLLFVGPVRRLLAPWVRARAGAWVSARGVIIGTMGPGAGWPGNTPPSGPGASPPPAARRFDHPLPRDRDPR